MEFLLLALGANLFMLLILRSKNGLLDFLHKKFGDKEAVKRLQKNRIKRLLISERGEAGDAGDKSGSDNGEMKFTAEQQKFVDKIIDKRYQTWKNEEKTKYGDYEDLRKFKDEHSRAEANKQQEELEKAKKYEEAKKGYETKLTELNGLVSKKDQEINDLRINHVLTNEINRQNGYSEETLALIKSNTLLDANGNVVMKLKDANGIEQTVSAAEGIKKLLEARPYLVKSSHKSGSGTGSGSSSGETGSAGGAEDLTTLNSEYSKAFNAGDLKKARELKIKIQSKLQAKTAVV